MPTNDAEASWDQMVVVGRVARAHGNKGAVIVNLDTDFPERRFREGNVVFAHRGGLTQELRMTSVRFQGGRPVVTVDGVTSMDQAEALAGTELRVPERELFSLPPDRYYHHQLVGCAVRTIEGEVIGTVTDVQAASGAHRLLVQPADGSGESHEIDVPLAEPICVRVDPEHQVIVVDPPEGLLDLNRR